MRIWKSGKVSQVSGCWSPRMVFMSTANRDQKSSLCSTKRSLNHANAWRKNKLILETWNPLLKSTKLVYTSQNINL